MPVTTARRRPSGLKSIDSRPSSLTLTLICRLRLAASHTYTAPTRSPAASRAPSGLTARCSGRESSRITPIDSGLHCRVANNAAHDRSDGSNRYACVAYNSARSHRSVAADCAQRPHVGGQGRLPARARCDAATPVATPANTSNTAIAAARVRSRRIERRRRTTSASARARPAARNSRSMGERSWSWSPAHSSAAVSRPPR